MCAAAGVAALDALIDEDACAKASATGRALREGLNDLFEELGVPWAAYGEHSAFYIYTDPHGDGIDPRSFDPFSWSIDDLKRVSKLPSTNKLRLAMLVEGVDISSKPGGIVSATHGEAEVAHTLQAFRSALGRLREEREIPERPPPP